MSDRKTPLAGAVDTSGIIEIRELPARGMITLRGDQGSDALRAAAWSATGLDVPPARGAACGPDGETGMFWMSPDELLLMCPRDEVRRTLAGLDAALDSQHSLAVDVSDARALLAIKGVSAREVLAKLAPVDLAPGRFEPGELRRTRLAQVAAAVWMPRADTFHIVCFRSQARYVFDLLRGAAQPGSSVGMFLT